MSSFEIVYKGDATQDGFDMAVIGKSMMGFSSLLRDFYKVCGIDGEPQIKTTEVRQGSVIITGQLLAEITAQLITNPELFLEALRQVDITLWEELTNFMSTIGNTEKSINDFFNERQFTAGVISNIVGGVPSGLLVWWLSDRLQRKKTDERISRLERKIEILQRAKKFNKALEPLQANGYDSITYVTHPVAAQQKTVIVEDRDLDMILPEDSKILPNYQNGMKFDGTGKVKSLSFTRGDRVGISFYHDAAFGSRVYPAFPNDGQTSTSYRNLYGEDVIGEFEVVRRSDFKVPEFKIISLEKQQSDLIDLDRI